MWSARMQKVSDRQKLVEHFALFFESLLVLCEMPKLELRRGSDPLFEL